jgi:hypothetical protein
MARLTFHTIVAVAAVVVASSAPAPNTPDAEGATFVKSFFRALDRRDLHAVREAFAPEATIVHDDGVQQTVAELVATIRKAKTWDPRRRTINSCRTQSYGAVLVVGCLNRVEFLPKGHKAETYTYNETWVLKRTPAGLRAVRSHYSLVSKQEHSEG